MHGPMLLTQQDAELKAKTEELAASAAEAEAKGKEVEDLKGQLAQTVGGLFPPLPKGLSAHLPRDGVPEARALKLKA